MVFVELNFTKTPLIKVIRKMFKWIGFYQKKKKKNSFVALIFINE